MDGKEIWDKLHWFNFPDLEERSVSKDEYFTERLRPSINNNEGKPFYVYMFNNRINKLDLINHSENTVEYLNTAGVTFYLTEPLGLFDITKMDTLEKQEAFFKCPDIRNQAWEGCYKYNLHFYNDLIGDEKYENLRADELNTIVDYIERNNLTNVVVKTCDYQVEKYLPYYNKWMTLQCEDIFVKNTQWIYVQDQSMTGDFTKKFVDFNWRWTPHRNLMAAFLKKDESYISFYHKLDYEFLTSFKWFDFSLWDTKILDRIKEGLEYIDNNVPLSIDIKLKSCVEDPRGQPYPNRDLTIDEFIDPMQDLNGIDYTVFSKIEKVYNDIFCDIVTESRFAQPTGNYSEKVQQPMFYGKPFILLAPPYTLQYLREKGYKTFSDFWDESYDTCENHQERLLKIFDLVSYIESKSIEELREIYCSMKPILKHNMLQLRKNMYVLGF